MSDKKTKNLGEEIIKEICKIYDPEIPVNIYELGLIYDVKISDDNDVMIEMTLTSPNCPVAESLPLEVEEKVGKINEINDVKVNIVFEPPWTKEMMSEEAKLELGML
jgi:FeS assembly SUF system protein